MNKLRILFIIRAILWWKQPFHFCLVRHCRRHLTCWSRLRNPITLAHYRSRSYRPCSHRKTVGLLHGRDIPCYLGRTTPIVDQCTPWVCSWCREAWTNSPTDSMPSTRCTSCFPKSWKNSYPLSCTLSEWRSSCGGLAHFDLAVSELAEYPIEVSLITMDFYLRSSFPIQRFRWL